MISQIQINFPEPIEFPKGFEGKLIELVSTVCKKYETEYPNRVMWPAGNGFKAIMNEPHEPTFDESIYCIDVAEREKH